MNSKEFKEYMKNNYKGAFDSVYTSDAISLMEECDNDATHFLDVVLDTISFWKEIADIIQLEDRNIRFWVCDCIRQNVHSKQQRDNCPACGKKQKDATDAYISDMREQEFFTSLDLHDYACGANIHEYPPKMDASCGAYVCIWCGWHKGLARCFCGWAASGGDGAQELVDMGETI